MKLQDIIAEDLVIDLKKSIDVDLITQIQTRLKDLKLLKSSDVDGIIGPITLGAWARFKEIVGQGDKKYITKIGKGSAEVLINKKSLDLPKKETKVPKQCLDIIKKFEGCHRIGSDGRVYAYPDPLSGGKPYTIGYGNTRDRNGKPFKLGDSITKQEAEDLFIDLVEEKYWNIVAKTVPYWNEMNDNQRSALCSFAYNLGAHFYGSRGFNSISQALKHKLWHKVPEIMYRYRNPGSRVEAGLARRRREEGKLWKA